MEIESEQALVKVDSDVEYDKIIEEFEDVSVIRTLIVEDDNERAYYHENQKEEIPEEYSWDDHTVNYRITVDGNEFIYIGEVSDSMPPSMPTSSDYNTPMKAEPNNMIIRSNGEGVYSAFEKVSHVFGDLEVISKATCIGLEEEIHSLDLDKRNFKFHNFRYENDDVQVIGFPYDPNRIVINPKNKVLSAEEVIDEYSPLIEKLTDDEEFVNVKDYKVQVMVDSLDKVMDEVSFEGEKEILEIEIPYISYEGGVIYVVESEDLDFNVVVSSSPDSFEDSEDLAYSFIEEFDLDTEKKLSQNMNYADYEL